jgi:hypothetical protein
VQSFASNNSRLVVGKGNGHGIPKCRLHFRCRS